MRLSFFLGALVAASVATGAVVAGVAGVGCGDSGGSSTFGPTGLDAAPPEQEPAQGFSDGGDDGPYSDFPATPVTDTGAPANAGALFGGATAAPSGGPCLMEPEIGSMFPRNWLRPRFRWIADDALDLDPDAGGGDAGASPAETLYELRVHADNQINDLVVYTASSSWTMPKDMWDGLRTHSAGAGITLSIKGGVFDGTSLTSVASGPSGPIAIAPVDAPGTIVYWTTISGGPDDAGSYNPVLKGFHVGDESVTDVLKPAQMAPTDAGAVQCLGCHNSTPDGLFAAVSTRPNPSGGGLTQVGFGAVDGTAKTPSYVTAAAQALLDRSEQELPSFSGSHFAPGDRVAVSMLRTTAGYDIVWTDLETTSAAQGTAWDVFARTGDAQYAALANPSHDGTKIVYVSTPDQDTSGTIVTQGSIFTIPWGARKGGAATEVMGANAAGSKQYYPTFSPDDELIAYDRSTAGTSSYDDPKGEVYVIPSSGGTAERLHANDPPACSGAKSPGTFNNWPKWSPQASAAPDGKKYYFLVFSSARNNGTARFGARLYVTPVVVDQAGTITTYAALYLWNQPENEDNHSPAWDTFQIPNVVH